MIHMFLLLCAAVAMTNAQSLRDLYVRAEGQVTCKGRPYSGDLANISLVVKSYVVYIDHPLLSTRTLKTVALDANGRYSINGSVFHGLGVDNEFELKLIHHCPFGFESVPADFEAVQKIPGDYVSANKAYVADFHLGGIRK
ncbi:hypothetical protein AAVH_09746 [Aphelenchoides avenae]|nr:hypothetical protein AAVH_09746 [Aphelenchus avenae]